MSDKFKTYTETAPQQYKYIVKQGQKVTKKLNVLG